MTQEEKARAYDEALEKARAMYGGIPADNAMLEEIFPELAESEDERIRKGLIFYLKADLEHNPSQAKSFYEEAIAYLEKHKENPKSANSISADCTSLAKCEDRDSKYGAFPEDVIVVARACKKLEAHGYPELAHALKNVNLCTKEQKPLTPEERMNHPLYLEGFDVGRKVGLVEAERKPDIPLMNGDADLYFDNLIQYYQPTRRQCFEEGIKYAQRLSKEQEPEEHVPENEETGTQEQKPVEIDELKIIKKHITEDSLSSDVNKRLKDCGWHVTDEEPVEWSEEDETAFSDLMWCIKQASKSAKDENDMGNIWFAENWVKNRLKSLRPSWKPSEEDVRTLERALFFLADKGFNDKDGHLESIYNNIKKL